MQIVTICASQTDVDVTIVEDGLDLALVRSRHDRVNAF